MRFQRSWYSNMGTWSCRNLSDGSSVEKDEYTELVSITTTRGELVSRASRSSV